MTTPVVRRTPTPAPAAWTPVPPGTPTPAPSRGAQAQAPAGPAPTARDLDRMRAYGLVTPARLAELQRRANADADAAIRTAKGAARKVVLLRIMTVGGIRYVPVKMVG